MTKAFLFLKSNIYFSGLLATALPISGWLIHYFRKRAELRILNKVQTPLPLAPAHCPLPLIPFTQTPRGSVTTQL